VGTRQILKIYRPPGILSPSSSHSLSLSLPRLTLRRRAPRHLTPRRRAPRRLTLRRRATPPLSRPAARLKVA
jgi:hypothetical protein